MYIKYKINCKRHMNKYKTLSIIIPVFNEEDTIKKLIECVEKVSLERSGLRKEMIIVDDFSTDNTRNILKNLQKTDKMNTIKIIYHSENKGKGSSIRTGLSEVTGEIVLIQDADLEYDPAEYPLIVEPICKEITQVVYGSRRLKKSNKKHSSLSFYVGGVFITWFANILYGLNLTDEPTCYKVFLTSTLRNLNLKCARFEFCPEVTAKLARKNIKIYEVPISYYPRSTKEGKKINWKDGVYAIWWLLKLRFAKLSK